MRISASCPKKDNARDGSRAVAQPRSRVALVAI